MKHQNDLHRGGILAIIAICFLASAAHAVERIWIDAKINDKPARFSFDTGAGEIILWRPSVKKFGLKLSGAPSDARRSRRPDWSSSEIALTQWTDDCNLMIWGSTVNYSLAVIDRPSYLDSQADTEDGFVGWNPVRRNVFSIDAVAGKAEPLDAAPQQTAGWTQLRISTNDDVLILESPDPPGKLLRIRVDTGDPAGAQIRADLWRRWKASHPKAATTLMASYTPAIGVHAEEVAWAEELRLGSLTLSGVPLSENSEAAASFDATLGMAALKRLEFIVDGKHAVAYVRPRKTAPPPYEHNHIGAVFLPPQPAENGALVARVLAGSPADEAGIRDGDELLKIDGHDMLQWRTDSDQMALLDFEQPAGTRMSLSLMRGGETFETVVVFRKILGPSPN